MEFDDAIRYRRAYGLAFDLAESGFGAENFPGKLRRNAAAGGTFEVILAEVLRQIGTAEQGEGQQAIRDAVGDALAGRRPRWWWARQSNLAGRPTPNCRNKDSEGDREGAIGPYRPGSFAG